MAAGGNIKPSAVDEKYSESRKRTARASSTVSVELL